MCSGRQMSRRFILRRQKSRTANGTLVMARRSCGSNPIPATTSEQVTLVPIFLFKKISHLLHCSSFFVKGHAQVGYSFVNALIKPLFRYQPFYDSVPSARLHFYHSFFYITKAYLVVRFILRFLFPL